MSASSSARIVYQTGKKKQTLRFTGVISIEHSLSLSLSSTSSQGSDVLSGAKNQPDQVTLTVKESDAARGPGWSADLLKALKKLKKERTVFKLITSVMTYRNMLLTDIAATQDEENQDGWSGTLVCTEYSSSGQDENSVKTGDNSSTRTNTGTTGSAKKLTDADIRQILQRAGVKA